MLRSFKICSLQQVVLEWRNKGEWDRQSIWNVWGGKNNYIGLVVKKFTGKTHIEGLGVDKKVKCTLVQALRLCTGRTAHRGSRDIALPFIDHGTKRGWGVSLTPRPLFTPGKEPVITVQEAGWAPGPVWTGAENFAPPTGIRSPDRPTHGQSLYRLRYLGH